jgi:FKBP12-rapamycin complex-associated protein
MLVNAMEISGIEGNFRNTCEQVMSVLRQNKDSLMAMLEVFLYEPLVSWRILAAENAAPSHSEEGEEFIRDRIHAKGPEAEMTEQLNKKAVDVLERVVQKLTGNDFADERELSVPEQVDRLIKEARSVKNLAQSYIGWCPFW